MKLILCEGGDNLGKNSLIKGLCEHLNYDNVTIRHFGKPPKGMQPKEVLDFQFKCFKKEYDLYRQLYKFEIYDKYHYYPETVIWNRSYLGEFVYAQMFRNGNPKELKKRLIEFEKAFISHKVYLITLIADPEFFHSKEDGQSFSQKLDDKTAELELFKEAHEFSIIPNKKMIKVDNEGSFRTKEEILNEVIQFINETDDL